MSKRRARRSGRSAAHRPHEPRLLGLVIPLVLEIVSARGKEVVGSVLASASLILLGGLFLRAAVLLGGQMV